MRRPLVWLVGCAGLSLGWWLLGRPVLVAAPLVSPEQRLECVSYTPYAADQAPWDFARGMVAQRALLDRDLELIARYSDCIRIYSVTGIGALPDVARAHQLQILFGGWVNGNPVDTRRELRELVRVARAYPDVVRAVIVGNETLLRKEVTSAQLIDHVEWVRAELPGVPLTYADVWEFWLEYPELAPHVDFLTIHVLPYWENDPAPTWQAIAHLEKVLTTVRTAFPARQLLVGEIGWPSEGRMRERSWPGRAQQSRYLRTVVAHLRAQQIPYNIIEAIDQPWKRNSEGTVGGYWGLFDAERHDKGLFAPSVSNVPDWQRWCIASLLLWTVLLSLAILTAERVGASPFPVFLLLWCASLALSWQCRADALAVRSWSEAAWAGMMLLVAVASALAPMLLDRSAAPRWWTRSIPYSVLGLLLVTSLTMVADARYRSFPTAVLSIGVLGWALLHRRGVRLPERAWRMLPLLIGTIVLIFWQETPWNPQALWWCGLCFGAGVLLPRIPQRTGGGRLPRLLLPALLICGAYLLAALLRYGVMESTTMVTHCAVDPLSRWCDLRSTVGLLIHDQAFGTLALGCGAAALVNRSRPRFQRTLAVLALIAAVWGMTLYTVDRAVWGFLLAWSVLADSLDP